MSVRLALALLGLLAPAVSVAAPPAAPATTAARPAGPPALRLCTGPKGGQYEAVAQRLTTLLAGQVDVQQVRTHGSWDNLQALHADPPRCDAALAQEDAHLLYRAEHPDAAVTLARLATLYSETVHLLCNRAVRADRLVDLDPKRDAVLVAPYGSGTYITWTVFARLVPALARIRFAEVTTEEGLLKVVDGVTASCLLIVNAPGGPLLALAERGFGHKLKLVEVKHPQLHRLTRSNDRPVYRDVPLRQRAHPRLLAADQTSQAVDAVFFVHPEWQATEPVGRQALTRALLTVATERAAAAPR